MSVTLHQAAFDRTIVGDVSGKSSEEARRKSPGIALVIRCVVLPGYVSDKRYLGAVVGRVANRIALGRFVVEGKEHRLDVNNGPNALHGGLRGFNKVR